MKRYVFVAPVTGDLHHQVIFCEESHLESNTPPGMVAVESDIAEPSRSRYDWQTGQFVDSVASPNADKVWHADQRRWVDSPAKEADVNARRLMALLENQSLRALREHLLGDPEALKRLHAVDAQISSFRSSLLKP